ncbi:MAG TPA: ATP-binding protein [Roseiflexaceae bacterium]|nr:ATP-binding protein [Roseiflexaceae bacterium]HMP43134.1 ATP-binding protein [Roseiflexaceae bacterium]
MQTEQPEGVAQPANPFTERGRITRVERFIGRWAELSLIFGALENRRPVLLCGTPGIGKSSLLTHIVAAAAANFEEPELRSYYLRLDGQGNAADVYRAVINALGAQGETTAALEIAMLETRHRVVLCLDDVDTALTAGWGAELLESLARVARNGMLLLVAALDGAPPALSERFTQLTLGAFAAPELRLLVETYLEATDITVTPGERHQLAALSALHPAYLQRAAFHLFRSKLDTSYNWRAAYLNEAREHPIAGAPLPPAIFEGAEHSTIGESAYSAETVPITAEPPVMFRIPQATQTMLFLLPLLVAGGVGWLSGNILFGIAAAGATILLSILVHRIRR